jgi:BNR/Asp-box repeat
MRRSRRALITPLAAGLLLAGCSGDSDDSGQAPSADAPKVEDPGPIHVHGLGVNPDDGALFVATHTGLFRAAEGERTATRVADRFQDTMGFTVVGPDRFLGSGHPDGRENLPPFLGLIESRDAGRTWKPISLLGKRDFHVLEASGKRVYGFGSDFDTKQAGLLVSDDGGRTWEERTPPEALVSLAIDPQDPDRVVASGEQGLYLSSDAGRGWRPLDGGPALLAWPAGGGLFAVAFDGSVARSGDAGRSWRRVGRIGGEPAAFEGADGGDLYAALHDGMIMRSADGGASWSVRSTP